MAVDAPGKPKRKHALPGHTVYGLFTQDKNHKGHLLAMVVVTGEESGLETRMAFHVIEE